MPRSERTISQIDLIDKYVSEGWENRLSTCKAEQLADVHYGTRIGSNVVHKWGCKYSDASGTRAIVWKYTLTNGHIRIVISYLKDDDGNAWIPLPRGYN